MASSILWQNSEHTVTLIDVPGSIAAAQNTTESSPHARLISSEPLKTPYNSQEPKTLTATAKIANNTINLELHQVYANIIHSALSQIRAGYASDWCLQRCVCHSIDPQVAVKRRKLDHDEASLTTDTAGRSSEENSPSQELLPLDFFASLTFKKGSLVRHAHPSPSCSECGPSDCNFYSNCGDQPRILRINSPSSMHDSTAFSFSIPAQSSFFLSNCSASRKFHAAVRIQAQAHDTRRHFNAILLDPPWPNRSVRRAHQTPGTSYSTSPTLPALRRALMTTDLDMLMADNCLVGMWITNKPAVREFVLEEGGIFDMWGLKLEEEWVWVKTTVSGEPVSELDGVWRKPYEVFLLGRRNWSADSQDTADEGEGVKRRVLVGVPDLHSRKPCLKELIEPMLAVGDGVDPRVLEMFARHLVAGWWSWGNECIKFNWEGHWHNGV